MAEDRAVTTPSPVRALCGTGEAAGPALFAGVPGARSYPLHNHHRAIVGQRLIANERQNLIAQRGDDLRGGFGAMLRADAPQAFIAEFLAARIEGVEDAVGVEDEHVA